VGAIQARLPPNTVDEADLVIPTASALPSGNSRTARTKLLRTAWWKSLVKLRKFSLDPKREREAADAQRLNYVLQVSGLCIAKLFDLFMLQGARSAKLMCGESYACQVLDYLHLLKGFQ
jgi:hypothetical protein